MEIITAAVTAVILTLILIRIFAERQNKRLADLELRLKKQKDIDNLNTKVEQILSDFEKFCSQTTLLSEKFEKITNDIYLQSQNELSSLRNELRNLKAEVENANRIPESSLSENDVQRIAESAVKKFVEQNLNNLIEKNLNSRASTNITPQDIEKIISEKLPVALNAAFQGFVQNQINPAFQQVYQRISDVERKIPQTSFLPPNHQEYQKQIESLLEVVTKQNESIDELKQQLAAQQKIIDELQKSPKVVQETPPIKISTPEEISTPKKNVEQEIILKISDKNSLDDYKKRLQNLEKLKNFSAEHVGKFKWFKIDKIEADIKKLKMPEEFDEYTTGKIVNATIKIFKKFMSALDSCDREIKNPAKNSADSQELKNLIEEYLKSVGVNAMNFKPGDNYDDWADLGMEELPITKKTKYIEKHNTLKEIYVQPHFLYFVNENEQKERRIFGGTCSVYVFEE